MQKMTPNTKVDCLLKNINNEENVEQVKTKLLFTEVIHSQLKENIDLTKNGNEKK